MKLSSPFIQLPIRFDASTLNQEIAALGEICWRPHPQKFPGNSMLPLLAVNGDPANESFYGEMTPTPQLLHCPYLLQVLGTLGATLGRTRLMRLSGHAEVTRHADQGYYWAERVRVHIPVVTQPTVRFECGESVVNMAAGECWIFDTWRQHRVINDADDQRIHLVVDTVGGARFWDSVAKGRPVPERPAHAQDWQPEFIAPDSSNANPLVLETMNIPAVMTPWELDHHLAFLFSESLPSPQIQGIQIIAAQFSRRWRALWAAHAESPRGRQHYRKTLDEFLEQIKEPASQVMLKNEIRLFSAIMTLVGKVALLPGPAAHALPHAASGSSPLVSRA